MKRLLFILSTFHFAYANAATIHVGKEQVYKTITAAIAAANTGDTVLVDAGRYAEKKIIINNTMARISNPSTCGVCTQPGRAPPMRAALCRLRLMALRWRKLWLWRWLTTLPSDGDLFWRLVPALNRKEYKAPK